MTLNFKLRYSVALTTSLIIIYLFSVLITPKLVNADTLIYQSPNPNGLGGNPNKVISTASIILKEVTATGTSATSTSILLPYNKNIFLKDPASFQET